MARWEKTVKRKSRKRAKHKHRKSRAKRAGKPRSSKKNLSKKRSGQIMRSCNDFASGNGQFHTAVVSIWSFVNECEKQLRYINKTFRDFTIARNWTDQIFSNFVMTQEQFAQIAKDLQAIAHYAENIQIGNIVVNPDNTVSYGNQIFDIHDIQTDLEKIADDIIDRESVAQSLKNLKKSVDSIPRNPVYKQVIVGILIGFILQLCVFPVINKARLFLSKNKSAFIKAVRKTIPSYYLLKDLTKYRIVNKCKLTVRQQKKQKSKAIGQLHCGQIVKMVKKNKNWTLIQLEDEDNKVIIRGWVLTRYLKKTTTDLI